jgi:hypothetical protein
VICNVSQEYLHTHTNVVTWGILSRGTGRCSSLLFPHANVRISVFKSYYPIPSRHFSYMAQCMFYSFLSTNWYASFLIRCMWRQRNVTPEVFMWPTGSRSRVWPNVPWKRNNLSLTSWMFLFCSWLAYVACGTPKSLGARGQPISCLFTVSIACCIASSPQVCRANFLVYFPASGQILNLKPRNDIVAIK